MQNRTSPQHSNIENIIKYIRKLNQRELLEAINLFAKVLEKEPGRFKVVQWPAHLGRIPSRTQVVVAMSSLISLTKVVLAHGQKWANTRPTERDIIFLQNQIQNLPTHFTTELPDSIGPDELFLQLSFQQFPFQRKREWTAVGRTMLLFREVPKVLSSEGDPPPFDLEKVAQSIYGMSLSQFIWIGLFIYSHSLNAASPYLRLSGSANFVATIKDRWSGDSQDMPTSETFYKFVSLVSSTPAEFKEMIGDLTLADERLISVNHMPLLSRPVVRLTADEIVVPIPKLLIERITSGVFYDFADQFKGTGRENPFRTYFGKVFERYAEMQLELVFPKEVLYPEKTYDERRLPTPDWVVADEANPLALECRSSTFSLPTRVDPSMDGINKDLHRIGVDTIIKAETKLQDLKDGVTHIPIKGKEVSLILCTWEDVPPLRLFGSLLLAEIKKQGGCQGSSFYLVPISYLEDMTATKDKQLFLKALETLQVRDDWDNLGDGPESKWREALAGERASNPLIEQAARTFFSALPLEPREASQ